MSTGIVKLRWARKNREKVSGHQRRYYRKFAQQRRDYSREWGQKNPDRVREKHRKFVAENPNYFREYRHRRKLRLALHKFASILAANRRLSTS